MARAVCVIADAEEGVAGLLPSLLQLDDIPPAIANLDMESGDAGVPRPVMWPTAEPPAAKTSP